MIPLGGMQIIEDRNMTDLIEDWSNVRSPSRARRRRKKHKQRIVFRLVAKQEAYQIGDRLVMHPDMARKLREAVSMHPRTPSQTGAQ